MNDVSFETAEFISRYASASHKFFGLIRLMFTSSILPVFYTAQGFSIRSGAFGTRSVMT
jgi:hypothetical protein